MNITDFPNELLRTVLSYILPAEREQQRLVCRLFDEVIRDLSDYKTIRSSYVACLKADAAEDYAASSSAFKEYSTQKNWALLMSLVGGKSLFEALPVLDIGEREGVTGNIDFIKPEEMSHSIMRGQDKFGRDFLTFRAQRQENGFVLTRSCMTLFRKYCDDSAWFADGGFAWFDYEGPIISEGRVNKKIFTHIKELLQTGKTKPFDSFYSDYKGTVELV